MRFSELEIIITSSGRRSIASMLVAYLLDAFDNGADGVDLDFFQSETGYIRTNITQVASYLKEQGIISIYYYRDSIDKDNREYIENNIFGRWAKQHYKLTTDILNLYKRSSDIISHAK